MQRKELSSTEEIFDILAAIRRREQTGVERLYQLYSGALYHMILKIVPESETAQEILQDVFLRIWNKIDSYDAQASRPFTWMARIARNRAIDHLRSGQKSRDRQTDQLPDYVANHSPLSEELYTDYIGLSKLMNGLDAEHRLIIEYLYFREYSQSEAAEALNIPLGTIKTRSRRALQQLRNMLGKELLTISLPLLLALGRMAWLEQLQSTIKGAWIFNNT